MRYALAVLVILAGAAVWLLLRESESGRVVRRDTAKEAEGVRGTRASSGTEAEAARAGESGARGARTDDGGGPAPTLRLVYADGTPAAGVALHLAVGRPLHTKKFRNGDYPEKVVWLVTYEEVVDVGADGVFTPPRGTWPSGTRLVAFTEPDSAAYVLAEVDPHQGDVPAARRVRVTGVLRAPDGKPHGGAWVAAQTTRPEDWQTRNSKEMDSFVHGRHGDLGVDPGARVEEIADGEGHFALRVAPGTNWLLFGESGRLGTREVAVAAKDLDLGDIVLAPPEEPAPGDYTVHGRVRDCAGRPRPHTAVWIWDGNVGAPSHVVDADAEGRFRCEGLTSPHAIVWGVAQVAEHHVVLPAQSSGIIPLPCHTPIALTVPAREEYQWLEATRPGFHLIERDGVFLGGSILEAGSAVGLPPGRYHLVVLTGDGRILEANHVVTSGGNATLRDLRDTTQG